MRSPPAALLALDGKRLDALTPAELAVFQRYRNGRPKDGRPWISVGRGGGRWGSLCCFLWGVGGTSFVEAGAPGRPPTQAQADEILKRAGAVVCVQVYD